MKLGKRRLGAASCVLSHSDDLPESLREIIQVTEVYTDPWHRGKGIANRLLEQVCAEADKSGTILMLIADDDRLETWYSRLGFVRIQDEPILMARQVGG